jgi:hypothetical protein
MDIRKGGIVLARNQNRLQLFKNTNHQQMHKEFYRQL